MKNNH